MAGELKACPFCGKPPKTRRNRNDGLYIFCSFDGCDAQPAIEAFGPEKDEEIVDSWNQRVPDAGLVDALKKTRNVMIAAMLEFGGKPGPVYMSTLSEAGAALRSAGVEP